MNKVVRVGVGTIVFRGNEVLLGQRKGSHGKDQWCFPGGHLEFGELPEKCAQRETAEETGLEITDVQRGPWTNDFFAENQSHYITTFMVASYFSGEAEIKEPEKFKSWQWFPCDKLPSPLFLPIQTLLSTYGSLERIRKQLYFPHLVS